MEILAAIVGFLALLLLVMFYGAFSWGYVLLKFWSWFVLPVFTTAPHITLVQAVGLMIVVSLFKNQDHYTFELNGTELNRKPEWALTILAPWVTLGVAWVVTQVL